MTDRRQFREDPPIRLIRLVQFRWVVVVVGLLVLYATLGTPHLRFQYQWNGDHHSPRYWRCDYVGQFTQRIVPHDGKCPLIRFFKRSGDDHGRN